jgi:tetratricopeptide (TPR) repeat protein
MALRGDVEPALVQYRHSLDDLRQISIAREVKLRLGFAQHLLAYVQDTQSARAEALHAAIETERLLGEIEAQAGKLDAAQTHFEKALKLADSIDDAFVLAKLHENVGLLHTQRGDLARSMASFDEAERSYRAYGNQVCAIGITENNRAYAYMMSSQHDKAIPHLHRSLTFFESARMPHQEAICHANLAEAYLHTDALELAERHSLRGLRFEDVSIRPQCLYVLGHVKRKQFAFDEAERLCKDAIADAQQSQDVWALAPAYAALAETYRDWGRLDDAQTAFEQAIAQNVQLGQHGEAERLNILKAQS